MNRNQNQNGFVAIFVCIVIMLIVGILIISFTTISNREVQVATNRELSLQALYASESGINDVYSIIKKNNGLKQQTSSCTTDISGNDYYSISQNAKLSASTGVSEQYTCVLVNGDDLTSLDYDCGMAGVCPNDSLISYLQSSTTASINNLTIGWSDSATTTCVSNPIYVFPIYTAWPTCLPELLRVDIVTLNDGTTRLNDILTDDLKNETTFFIQPTLDSGNSNSISFQSLPLYNQTNGANSFIKQTYCTESAVVSTNPNSSTNTICSLKINGLPSTNSDTVYYVRIQYYYNPNHENFSTSSPTITLCANECGLALEKSQVIIDVNGYSGGVEERTSARISLQSGVSGSTPTLPVPPNYAVQSYDSICKSLIVDGSSIYEEMPSSTKGGYPSDLISPPNTQTDPERISVVIPSDFCDPIGVY